MMTIEDILQAFNLAEQHFPSEAIKEALKQKEAITPYFLSSLKNIVDNYKTLNLHGADYIFALYILSQFREEKAFPYIIALASLPGEIPEILLDYIITEGLPRFIVSTFDGNFLLIKQLIENPEHNDWSRSAGLCSLLGLVAIEKLSRDTVITYLRTLFHSPLANDEFFLGSLIDIAISLYPEELLNEINQALENNTIMDFDGMHAWIQEVLALGKENCLSSYVFEDSHHLPVTDVEESMSWISDFSFNEDEEPKNYFSDFPLEIATTFVRSSPKIGRNEPCSCGSGLKYKKCCLN